MKYSYIRVQTNSKISPETFIGTTLRGTFGHILKEQVCIESHYDCDICVHKKRCLSYAFYPTSDDKYRSYRIDVRMHVDRYDFGIYLFGDSSLHARPIMQALYKMLHSHRILNAGKKISFPKSKIFYNNKEMAYDKHGTVKPFVANSQSIRVPRKESHDAVLHLLTPLFIKHKHTYKKSPTVEDIVRSVYKRKYFFEHQKMIHTYPNKIYYKTVSAILRERDSSLGQRYSMRQQQQIPIEGMLGEIMITGLDHESYKLLKWGEILGVGKGTALGAGAIKIE